MADSSNPERKNGPGRPFPKGVSGNPGGRHKQVKEFQDWLRQEAYPKAQAALLACLEDGDGRVRVAAVRECLDRMFGKPKQPITGEDGKPLTFDIAPMLERLAKP